MNKDDILFLGDLICNYDVSTMDENNHEYFKLLKDKIFAIVGQIQTQETNQKYLNEITEIEKKQADLLNLEK